MKRYDAITEERNYDLFGENEWTWIRTDRGAWDGPMGDWSSHRNKYFKYLKKRDAIITAGANQGLYVRFYSKLFRAVYAFEPDPLNFHCMVNNAQFDNVVKFNCALGEKAGMCRMQISDGLRNTGENRIDTQACDHASIIPVMPIDSFNFPHVDLIQLDVEGYEKWVLRGAVQTIKRCRPVLILEVPSSDVRDTLEEWKYLEVDKSGVDYIFRPLEDMQPPK